MYYPLRQTGAEVQDILDSVGPLQQAVETLQGQQTTLGEGLDAEVAERAAADEAQDAVIGILVKGTGAPDTVTKMALSKAISDQAVIYATGKAVAKSGYGISSALTLEKGKIYLFPLTSQPASDVAYLSRTVTNTYDKAIVYAYTYEIINDRRVIHTATADYDETLVYTYSYDADGNLIAIVDKDGALVPGRQLPTTRRVTETFYTPIVNQPAISSGKFLFVPTHGMDVVVSHVSAQLTGDVEVLDFQLTLGLVTTLLGDIQERVLCEAFGLMSKRIDSIEKRLAVQGDVKARSIDLGYIPKVCGRDMVIFEETRQEGSFLDGPKSRPSFLGQLCVDTVNKKVYIAYKMNATNVNQCWYELTITNNS